MSYLHPNPANQPQSITTNISGQVVQISGQTVVASVTTNISGQTVYLVSGNNAVQISGQPVSISGQTVVTSVTTNISGQTVYLTSGKNYILITDTEGDVANVRPDSRDDDESLSVDRLGTQAVLLGYYADASGFARLRVTNSGDGYKLAVSVSGQPVSISGQTVVASVTTNISGQTVYLVSGNNRIVIAEASGNNTATVLASTSDNSPSSNDSLLVTSFMEGYDQVDDDWNRLRVLSSGQGMSGIHHRLAVAISGDPVSISGQPVSISGQPVSVSGNMLSISGQPVSISGNAVRISGSMVSMSGQPVSVSGNMISISGQPVSVSGNAVLVSGQLVAVSGVVETNISGQTVYLVSGQNPVQLFAYDPSGDALRPLTMDESGGRNLRVAIGTDANDLVADVFTSTTDTKSTSNHGIVVVGYNHGYNEAEDNFARLRVTNSGQGVSGIAHRLVVAFSGDPVSISGQPVSISGQTVVASVTTDISGQTVYLASGNNDVQISGQVVRISGQLVAVSGIVGTSVSGNMVSVSGQAVSISGNVVVASVTTNISGQTVYTASGNNAAQISGQLVAVSGTVATSVSGNAVSISGQAVLISGQTVVASVTTNISGQTVYTASGNNNVQISGQAITITDDTNNIVAVVDVADDTLGNSEAALNTLGRLYGRSIPSTSWRPAFITQSGNALSGVPNRLVVAFSGDPVSISGQPVSISGNVVVASVTTDISGQTVYLTSGQNTVQNSGQAVRIAGSNLSTVADINPFNTDAFSPQGDGLVTNARLFGYESVTDKPKRVRVTASGQGMSGIHHKLAVSFSGDSIIGSVSGNMVSISGQPVSISGNVVVASVTTDISGQTVYLTSGQNNVQMSGQTVLIAGPVLVSGQTLSVSGLIATSVSGNMISISGQPVSVSGNMVSISGQPISVSGNMVSVSGQPVNVSGNIVQPRAGTTIRTFDLLPCSDASGGTVLNSGVLAFGVVIRNVEVSGNPMYVGGVSGNSPYSGHGLFLQGGDGVTLNVQNTNQVKVFSATTSGKLVSYMSVDL